MNTLGGALHRFLARSSRDALRLVREKLGDDAVVVSNRITPDGVEVMVMPSGMPAPMPAVTVPEPLAAAPFARAPAAAPALPPAELLPEPLPEPLPPAPPAPVPVTTPLAALAPAAHLDPDAGSAAVPDAVLQELLSMRGIIEAHLAGPAWTGEQRRDPLRGHLLRALLGAGFSTRLARTVLEAMPAGLAHAEGLAWLQAAVSARLPLVADDTALLDAGGVFALVGPTGVGKTTTTAKLAARCVMRFGPRKLALVTTDSFRIGAYEQLRIYGQILGVPVHAVKDATDLRLVLDDLRDKHMVLIDTVGMSQRDRAVSGQIAMLGGASRPVRRLLLLNATSHGDTLDEVVHAYRRGPGEPLAGCILTKMDEATHPGAVIDTVIRHELPVHYVSTGQKVPEHLELPQAAVLTQALFRARSRTALFVPGELDVHEQLAPLRTEADAARAELEAARLRERCGQLVRALAHDAREIAGHARALQDSGLGFAGAQALWRGMGSGQAPSAEAARLATAQACERLVRQGEPHLLALPLPPTGPGSPLALLLSARDGQPAGAASLEALPLPAGAARVVQLLGQAPAAADLARCARAGHHWMARVPGRQCVVDAGGARRSLASLAPQLVFEPGSPVVHRGRMAQEAIAQAGVQLAGPDGTLPARLLAVRALDPRTGAVLSQSFIVTDAALEAGAGQLVQWQGWRLSACSAQRLLRDVQPTLAAAGIDSASGAARTLAAHACALVLRLQQEPAAWAGGLRALLAQLAGRRTRAGRPVAAGVLFEGLGKFCVLLDALQAEAVDQPQPADATACA